MAVALTDWAMPITVCNFVVHWDEDNGTWMGISRLPPDGDLMACQGESPEQAFIEILALARYWLYLQAISAGRLSHNDIIKTGEALGRDQREAKTFLAHQETPHNTVNCLRGIIERMLPRIRPARWQVRLPRTGPVRWQVLPQRDTRGAMSYVVTTQQPVHRRGRVSR
jgi:hypothetical protein